MTQQELDLIALENFCEYLRIPSMHPNVDYDECVAFLTRQAQNLVLPINVYHIHPEKPIVVLTWVGTQPTKPSILLNSNMDVVPVFEDKWTYPPFSAHMDEQGNIYARGSQDMKCVGIQYLEAIRRLKQNGQSCERTIHISFVPDMEIGGVSGMKDFVNTSHFRNLNVGFALDGGMASVDENFFLFYGEKSTWQVEIKCVSTLDHGLPMMTPNETAGAKFRYILDHFMNQRAFEQDKQSRLQQEKPWEDTLSNMTTINLTKVWDGIQTNVEPTELNAMFHIHLSQTMDHGEFENNIKRWCQQTGPAVIYSFKRKDPKFEDTKLDSLNPYWIAFKKTCDETDIKLKIRIRPTSSDSRFLREVGIPVLGFSPINEITARFHDHNEYLNKEMFLKGVEIYTKIIPSIAKVHM